MQAYMYVTFSMYMYACMCMYMNVCMYVYIVCMCVYACVYIWMCMDYICVYFQLNYSGPCYKGDHPLAWTSAPMIIGYIFE